MNNSNILFKIDLKYKNHKQQIVSMYYRRYTRMHLNPAIKYLSQYGVLDKGFEKMMPLFHMENPPTDQYNPKRLSKAQIRQKDLDTKLIDKLFLKYPDLKYEPISHQKYPGRKFNTFSYAFSFIAEQKKLINQGYTIDKAFELTEAKYQQKMQRKLDQTLLSRGLAVGNRARSFLTLYQQQVEYESRLKVARTHRQLDKYETKLDQIRSRVEGQQSSNTVDESAQYQRVFQKILKDSPDSQKVPEGPIETRQEYLNNLEGKLSHVFNQFYRRAATKDKLDGLTDTQIMNSIHASPNKIKKQNKKLLKFLKSKGSISLNNRGQVVVSGVENRKLVDFLLTSPEIKIALLVERLNYEKPSIKNDAKEQLRRRRNLLIQRPSALTKQEKEMINFNKKLDMGLVSTNGVPTKYQAYKVFQTTEQRLIRLQIKYLNKVCEEQLKQIEQSRAQKGEITKQVKRYEQSELTLAETVEKFRRLKFRLEKRIGKEAEEDFIFKEHARIKEDIAEDDVEFEDMFLYLRKRSEERRLTSLSQVTDNAINEYLDVKEMKEAPRAEGEVKKESHE